ncbi:MAG: ferredoxin-type protein NapG [Betaproteobacteria bacterium]|nr:MAG: ferredoxin-type protein NapG [Betaproteobacteria bacterium]
MSRMSTHRRDFLVRMMQGATLATTGGLGWAYLLRQEARAQPFALRPPGALPEADFNAACIKCGQCVIDCPPLILKLQPAGGLLPVGTPYFEPRTGACVMCPDIPCMKACPTGALSPALKRIEDARMGLAVIDIENCLSYKGLRCEICHRECPIKGKAITLELHPRQTSKHAMFIPIVHSDACTGCGICVKACPTTEAAIRILPHALVQGKIGEHYRLGWTRDDEVTQTFDASAAAPVLEEVANKAAGPVKGTATDYLNDGGL